VAPRFLTLEEVLEVHADQVRRHGGDPGLRDLGLVESAAAMPRAAFGGVFAHEDVPSMAAAYLFHLAKNHPFVDGHSQVHPFVDGNKRTGLACALVFLDLNGILCVADDDALHDLVLGVVEGGVSKAAAAVFFREHARKRRRR
jgi:death-on-curing protein